MKKSLAISIMIISVLAFFPLCANASIAPGNWYLQASSQVSTAGTSQIPQIGGSLSQTGSIISGVLHVSNSECFDWSTGIPVSGTIDGDKVTLLSDGADGEIVAIDGTATSSNQITGTYTISAGCADGDYGTFTAVLVAPTTGTWTGAATSNGTAGAAKASLSQAAPDANGYSALSGTIALSGTCPMSGNLDGDQSWVLGNVVQGIAKMSDGSTLALTGFITDTMASANQITLNFNISGGSCSGQSGSVSYTRAAAN